MHKTYCTVSALFLHCTVVYDWLSSSIIKHQTGTNARNTAIFCLLGAGTEAFCSGGDQSVRGKGGYVGADGVPRLNVLDLQVGPSES